MLSALHLTGEECYRHLAQGSGADVAMCPAALRSDEGAGVNVAAGATNVA